MAKIVTVIDIGSNSVRMVIYEKTSRYAFHLLHEAKSKVRISQDAYHHNGQLQQIPMDRAFNALKEFLQISKSFKSKKILCVATSALRDAPNKHIFLQRVKQQLGLKIKIISGEKEAYFGALACANLLPKQTQAMSIDIGGGSTEIAFIDNDNVDEKTYSLKLGTVRLKELYFDKNDIEGAKEYIDTQLATIPFKEITTLIGIGGTFRAVSSAIAQFKDYPLEKLHALEYGIDIFDLYIQKVLDAQNTQELKDLFIKKDRYDVIKPGVFILQRVIHHLNITKIITSGAGVREGVYLNDLLRTSKGKFPHNYNTSVRYILDSFVSNKQYANNLASLSKKLFDLTHHYFEIPKQYRTSLSLSAKLYSAGSSVHFYSQHKHSYYLVLTALEYGFRHEDILLIATLCKYAKNKLPSQQHLHKYQLLLPEAQITHHLSYLLSLSIALLSHIPRNIDFDLSFEDGVLEVISDNTLYLAQESVAKLECSHSDFTVRFTN